MIGTLLAIIIPLACIMLWLGCARANFAYLARSDKLRRGVRIPICGEFKLDLAHTRSVRRTVSLAFGPFLALVVLADLIVTGGLKSHDELQAELAKAEAELAEANRKLEEE